MDCVVEFTENVQIVLHIPEDILHTDHGLIEHTLRREFNFTRRFNVYFLMKNDDKSMGGFRVRLLRLHSYLEKENIPHRLSVVKEPYSTEQTIKLSYFFWFDSEGVKKVFKYTPYIPTERDFLFNEYMHKIDKAGHHALNYMDALGDYKSHSIDSLERTSNPSQVDLRHLHLSKRLLSI